jgi:hypothetical protein
MGGDQCFDALAEFLVVSARVFEEGRPLFE